MLLPDLPNDLLAGITIWLRFKDLLRLKSCTPHLSLRIEAQGVVSELKVQNHFTRLSSVLHITRWLKRLIIHSPNMSPANKSHPLRFGRWIQSLPATIEDIDFDFASCLAIWIEPDESNSIHWSMKSSEHGFAPISIGTLLPQLQKLRLNDQWNFRALVSDWPQLSQDPLQIGSKSSRESTFHYLMLAYFLRQLPKALSHLTIRLGTMALLHHLPPHLTHFENLHKHYLLDNKMDLPKTLYESLRTLSITVDSSDHISHFSGFQHLHTLTINNYAMSSMDWRQLPCSLTALSVHLGPEFEMTQDFAQIPRSLLKLSLFGLTSAPDLNTQKGKKSNTDSDNPWMYLPPDLLDLSIRIDGGTWLMDTHFAGLRHFPDKLTSLDITIDGDWGTEDSLKLNTLSWIPCDRLATLGLSTASDKPGKNPSYDDILDTWPEGVPNNITKLRLSLFPARRFSVEAATRLPPNLTSLTLQEAIGLDPDFLKHCPRSLTSFKHINLGNADSPVWDLQKARDLLSAPHHSPVHPNIKYLEVETSVEAIPLGSPGEDFTLSLETDRKWIRKWIRKVEPRLQNMAFKDICIKTLPNNVTSIDLPRLYVRKDSPIWSLPRLKSLKVCSIHLGPIPASHLETLLLGRWPYGPSFFVDNFSASLTDLSVKATQFGLTSWAPLSKLTKLRTFKLQFTNQVNPIFLSETCDSIPTSVTSLVLAQAPYSFWRRFDPTPKSSSPTQAHALQSTWKLTSLDIENAEEALSERELRHLSHLTHLSIPSICVHNRLELYKKLSRNLKAITDLDLARTFLPSLDSISGPTKPEEPPNRVKWTFSDDLDQDNDNHEEEATGDNGEIELEDIEEYYLGENGYWAITKLPPSLTTLSLSIWHSNAASILPTSLTTLDLRSILMLDSEKSLGTLPPTLTCLAFAMSQCQPEVLLALPRTLKVLIIKSLNAADESLLSSLPPRLEMLELEETAFLHKYRLVSLLPQEALRTLILGSMSIEALGMLSPSLTRLECRFTEFKTCLPLQMGKLKLPPHCKFMTSDGTSLLEMALAGIEFCQNLEDLISQ